MHVPLLAFPATRPSNTARTQLFPLLAHACHSFLVPITEFVVPPHLPRSCPNISDDKVSVQLIVLEHTIQLIILLQVLCRSPNASRKAITSFHKMSVGRFMLRIARFMCTNIRYEDNVIVHFCKSPSSE